MSTRFMTTLAIFLFTVFGGAAQAWIEDTSDPNGVVSRPWTGPMSAPIQLATAGNDCSPAMETTRWRADNGDTEAQYQLGLGYLKGEVCWRDDCKALAWFKQAAERGHVNAQDSMGWRYYRGDCVGQDYVQAYMWWKVTVFQGHPDGPKQLKLAAEKLTPGQIEWAEILAVRCMDYGFRDCGR